MKADVTTLDNKGAGSIELAEDVFGVKARPDILHRVVAWQLARRRAGTAKTKRPDEVSGSGAKIWKQKGTGRARHASRRVTLFRGGAKAFGPVMRSHAHSLPKKIRKLGLRMALSDKRAEGKLAILDKAALDEPKTKLLAGKVSDLGWRSVLIIDGPELDENLSRAAANLPDIDILNEQGANVYDILRRDVLVLTRTAVERLEARLK